MNEASELTATPARPWHRNPLVRIGLWAVIGGIAGYGIGWMIAEYEEQVPALGRFMQAVTSGTMAQTIAAILTAGLLCGGIAMLILSRLSDARLHRALNADPDDNPARIRTMLPVAGWGMLIYAAMILVFLIPAIPSALGIATVIGGFTVVSWLFWRGTAMMDELEQAAQREALVAAFIIVEALGFGWAILHHYALAPAIEPVALVTALTLIYFVVGMIAAHRRGLAQ